MVTISADDVVRASRLAGCLSVRFRCQDGGDAFSAIRANGHLGTVQGSISVVTCAPGAEPDVARLGKPKDRVRVIARRDVEREGVAAAGPSSHASRDTRGYVRVGDAWELRPVQVVPIRDELFSRSRGLLETDVMADATVLVGGVGSVGSHVAVELAKTGLNEVLLDHDRVEVANVGRHVAILDDVGRFKVKVVAERILGKNPFAKVEACPEKISWDTEDRVRELVRRADLVVGAVDSLDARVILNKVCVEENKPVIFAGAFRRAYGGHILFVRPRVTPCYQCFLQGLPQSARTEQMSGQERAERVAYSDVPAPIEPGLSTDIWPLNIMVVKLAIQYLLRDKPTTLRSLDEDLTAPLYLWLNRREPGTDYEKLEPLGCNIDGLRVLRWYGIMMQREKGCPCCGDAYEEMAMERLAHMLAPPSPTTRGSEG
ncbi:ThiF family adenylyltransferase [Planctomycetota bacterium]